jgi:threonine/homoserine/homoserine lactone efflux protein
MMTIYLTVFFGIVAAQLAPGPNLLAVASVALAQGRHPAICVAAGVSTGVLIWVSACAFGIVTLFNSFPLAGAFLLGSGFSSQQVLLLAPIGAASALIIYGSYGILFSTSIANRIYTQSARGLDALFGVLFAGFGIKFLYHGVRELEASL